MSEDILMFIADIPLALKTLPQYLYYNMRSGHEFDMKKDALAAAHPII